MSLSEETLRAAAFACWENALSLSAEAKVLAEHGYGARAVGLAVLGLEEFAKAIGYAVAATSEEPDDFLVKKLKHLTSHEVKHLLAQSSEYAQIVTRDWADGMEWQTGFRPSLREQFDARFCQLAQGGLSGLLEEPATAKSLLKTTNPSTVTDGDVELLFGSELTNAALYVDIGSDGQVKTPARVASQATSEILGLDWFFEQYADLPCVLKDDGKWTHLVAGLRRKGR